jgi:hypothetical protein
MGSERIIEWVCHQRVGSSQEIIDKLTERFTQKLQEPTQVSDE